MAGHDDRALALESIGHRFADGFEMHDVDLSVGRGEHVCLLGPSGCGKTTLLRLAAGLEPLQHGNIWINGRHVAGDGIRVPMPPERRGIGFMFQDYALFPHMTVFENVCFGLDARDTAGRQRVREALRDMGLEHLSARYPHTLSGGQQQRIALLRALAPRPGVMLLDEPFSGLDEHLRQQVRQDTLDVLEREGAASLIVTHDPQEAMYLADRLVVMEHGRIVQDDTPLRIYHHPANPFVAALFGPVNEFLTTVRDGFAPTPLGPVPAGALAAGTPARVLVRASGISLRAASDGDAEALARVISARPLGQTSQVLVEPMAGAAAPGSPPLAPRCIEVRLPGLELPDVGQAVRLVMEAGAAFVFAV